MPSWSNLVYCRQINIRDREDDITRKDNNDHGIPPETFQSGSQHFYAGNQALMQGNYEESISEYRKALLHIPTFYEVYSNLGISLAHTNCFSEALQNLKKADKLKIGQNQANPSHNIIKLYLNNGSYFQGINLLLELISYRKNDGTARIMKLLISHLNSFHHYLQTLIKAQHKTLQTSVMDQLSRLYCQQIDGKMMIINFQQIQGILDRIQWKQLMETFNYIQIQYHKLMKCNKQHQYCQLYHQGHSFSRHLSKLESLQARKVISLLCAYAFIKEQTIALSWYFFSYIDQLQQNFLLLLLKKMLSKNNQFLLALKKSNVHLIQSIITKIQHKHIHRQREQYFLNAKRHTNQEIVISHVHNNYFLQCFHYILPQYQSDLSEQDMLHCVSGIAQLIILDTSSVNLAIQYLKDISNKNPSLQGELSYQIGRVYYLFGKFFKALSYFKRSNKISGHNYQTLLLIARCYFQIGSSPLIMEQFIMQLIQNMVLFEVISSTDQSNRMTAEFYRQFYVDLIIYFVLIKQIPTSYKLFSALTQTFAQDSENLKEIGELLLFKKAIFLKAKYVWSYQESLQLQLYIILVLMLSNQKEVLTNNLLNLYQENQRLFEASQQKFTFKHKIMIYSQMVKYCNKCSIDNFYVFNIQKMIRSLSNENKIQTCEMINQLKQVFFQSIKQKSDCLQRKSQQWILKIFQPSLNRLVIEKSIQRQLVQLKQKEQFFSRIHFFQQSYRQINLLKMLCQFSKQSDINYINQSKKLLHKLTKINIFLFIFRQLMKDSNFSPHEQQSKQSKDVDIHFEKMYSSKWLFCIFDKYQKDSNENQLWKHIKNFIDEDYFPENSTIYLKSRISEEYSDQSKNFLQCSDTQSPVYYHTQLMNAYLQKNYKSVYFSLSNQEHQRWTDSISLEQIFDIILFVVTLIMQLETNKIIIPSLLLKEICKNKHKFSLPKDKIFLKLNKHKEEDKIFQSTCCIIKCYLSLLQKGTQLQPVFKQINSLFISLIQKSVVQSGQNEKVSTCLRQLELRMTSHHLSIINNFMTIVFEKHSLQQNNEKVLKACLVLLQKNKINYKTFIKKLSNIKKKQITQRNCQLIQTQMIQDSNRIVEQQ